jgi:serine/threonine-protein kinase
VSPATDVYSLGLVAFEMLTGTRPFRGRSYAELLMRVIDTQAPSAHACNPALPPDVDAVMQGVLAKDPDERFTSANVFVRSLGGALDSDPPVRRAARRLARHARALFGRG